MGEAAQNLPRARHILAIPFPAQGHINPFMALCKVLAGHGFHVTIANVDAIHEKIDCSRTINNSNAQDQGGIIRAARLNYYSPALQKRQLAAGGDDDDDDDIKPDISFNVPLEEIVGSTLYMADCITELIQKLADEGRPVSCVVSDLLLSVASQQAADAFNLPRVAFVTSSPSVTLLRLHLTAQPALYQKALDFARLAADEPESVCAESLPGLPSPIFNRDLPFYQHAGVDSADFVYKFVLRHFQVCCDKALAVVYNTSESLEEESIATLNNLQRDVVGIGSILSLKSRLPRQLAVGPLPMYQIMMEEEQQQDQSMSKKSGTSLWEEDDWELLSGWLGKQPERSVLYISLGSVTILTESQFRQLLDGLEACGQRFLWALRPDTVSSEQSTVSYLSAGAPAASSCFVKWVPQQRVLCHPSVGGFLTHCGWNSTVEAVCAGVPMLCFPYFADQVLNAKYIVEVWKVGFRLSLDNVQGCVQQLMQGPCERPTIDAATQKNAAGLRRAMEESVREGGSSSTNLRQLLEILSI